MPVECTQMFREMFKSYDHNKDGRISTLEFKEFFIHSGQCFSDKQIYLYVTIEDIN